jgi:hypothetical protein
VLLPTRTQGTLFGALTLYEEAVLLQRQTEQEEAGR